MSAHASISASRAMESGIWIGRDLPEHIVSVVIGARVLRRISGHVLVGEDEPVSVLYRRGVRYAIMDIEAGDIGSGEVVGKRDRPGLQRGRRVLEVERQDARGRVEAESAQRPDVERNLRVGQAVGIPRERPIVKVGLFRPLGERRRRRDGRSHRRGARKREHIRAGIETRQKPNRMRGELRRWDILIRVRGQRPGLDRASARNSRERDVARTGDRY